MSFDSYLLFLLSILWIFARRGGTCGKVFQKNLGGFFYTLYV
jgi:hypothetical protein